MLKAVQTFFFFTFCPADPVSFCLTPSQNCMTNWQTSCCHQDNFHMLRLPRLALDWYVNKCVLEKVRNLWEEVRAPALICKSWNIQIVSDQRDKFHSSIICVPKTMDGKQWCHALTVRQSYLSYLQNAKGSSSDAQGVKDAYYILPAPDFRGTLIFPFRHQALTLLDPATPWTKWYPQ